MRRNKDLRAIRLGALALFCVFLLGAMPAMAGKGHDKGRRGHSDSDSHGNSHRGDRHGPPWISGEVRVANEPGAGWRVDLYVAGRTRAQRLGTSTSDGKGRFRFGRSDVLSNANLFVVARQGDRRKMLVLLGPPREKRTRLVVNELATIASIWTSAQFIHGDQISGNSVGLRSAARNVPNLVDLESGGLGNVIQNSVNGLRTTTLATLNTLASLLADCLRDGCSEFFELSTPPGAAPPSDTLQALLYVAQNPWNNVNEIFDLRPPARDGDTRTNPVFIPTLLWPPTAWTLSLVYAEGGFNAPGGMSIDARGNLWTNNNFMPGSQSVLANEGGPAHPGPLSYEGTGVTKLSSNGRPLSPPTGFLGGGTFGAAYGIAIDQQGHVWIGNFGGDSLSQLTADGTPISPNSDSQYGSSGGWKHDSFDDPQSVIVDKDGSIWTTNLMGDTVTEFVRGNPRDVRVFGGEACGDNQFADPWGLASDGEGRIWVTNFLGNSVGVIDPHDPNQVGDTLCPTFTRSLGSVDALSEPEGIAIDSLGNAWVARTGGARVTLLERSKNFFDPQEFTAEHTISGPWGVAVDGRDNVWIADFFGKRLHNLCGAAGNCPQGLKTGDPISPTGNPGDVGPIRDGGYGVNGAVQSVTSVVIDQAGNVWLANNFNDNAVCLNGVAIPPPGRKTTPELERRQPMCGGDGAVVVFGIAAPVAAPLIGPPLQP